MPTYEYECSACSYVFEALQSMTEPKLTNCPECGKDKLARLIGSGSGVIFKGSGFYETDYKRKSEPKPAASPCASGGCPNAGSCPSAS
jgi:putative FmdB family regulatory protein